MLIGIDASRANKIRKTGTEWYSYYLIRNLAKIDKKNRYLLYSKEPLREGLKDLGKNFKSKVLSWPPKFLWTQARLSWEMIRFPPDLLFVPAHTIPLIHPKKTITTCHDIGFERFPEFYSLRELYYHRWAMRFAIKHASHIITVSEFTKREMLEIYKINPQKIVVVHNGFNKNVFRSTGDQKKIQETLIKYKIKKPYILYIGRLEEKKNTLGLVKAFKELRAKNSELKTLKLLLIGQFGFGYEKVEGAIQKFNLRDEIIRPGWIKEEDRLHLMSGASLFVFPSFYEGFGIPPLEAMACGVPVVASRAASIPEVVGDAAFSVNPQDPQEIAEGMRRVLEDKNLREDLINKGFKRVKEFSWERCAKETLKVLLEV
ncbi:MAG: glycosyl transferase family 1 [Parcubacteria group bacterium CG23_combo_of_CG06-09_8_20_14_all_35_9]|nr:MAG: glycosyl transferase family 1 [Parcubacteria group bacterium CG23_combo_of_CG06-09_8_20_14_all_35_9]